MPIAAKAKTAAIAATAPIFITGAPVVGFFSGFSVLLLSFLPITIAAVSLSFELSLSGVGVGVGVGVGIEVESEVTEDNSDEDCNDTLDEIAG